MNIKRFLMPLCMLFILIATASAQKNTLSIPDVSVTQGKSIALPINLDNTADIVAVQFTLTTPNGITLSPETAQLSERSNGHSLTLKAIGTNKYMAMMFSPQNKPIIARTGKLLSVQLNASSTLVEGTTHALQLSDVVITDKSGNNLTTGFSAGNVFIAKSPDLEVKNASCNANQLTPGQKLQIEWQVQNIGGMPTKSGWSEQIFLDVPNGTSKLIGTTEYSGTLNASASVSRSAEITLPKELGISESAKLRIKVKPYSDNGEPTWLQTNNEATTDKFFAISKLLYVTPDIANVEEKANPTLRFKLTRSGSTATDETFQLSATTDSRITLPTSITIPRGQSGIYFYANVKANNVLDNDSIVSINITSNNYQACQAVIKLTDDRKPTLSIRSDQEDVTEGGTIVFHIQAERAPKTDTQIQLVCDASSRFKIPSSIILSAGSKSVDVTVEAVEDDVPDIEKAVSFTASAVGYEDSSMLIVLVDNDIPNLQLQLTPTAVSEGDGPLCVSAVLKRLNNIDKKVTIRLSDDSDGGIYYGRQTIEMAAGTEQVTINLGPIDNQIVDGERTVNITAAVYIASCSCNASLGSAGGNVTVPLTIYDNDGPTLSLSSSQSVLKEGNEMSITIGRNTNTNNDLTIQLSSDHADKLVFPTSVVIPAGQSSATFILKSIANSTTGDDFTATITAEAEGFAKANTWFSVTDQNMPDAQITDIIVDNDKVNAGDEINVSVVVKNTGLYVLPEQTKINFYVSSSNSAAATAFTTEPLNIGDSVKITRSITMPSAVGKHRIYAAINETHDVKELIYSNNSSNVLTIETTSPYTFNVSTDKNIYAQEEQVSISGSVSGKSNANKNIDVYVANNGYRHVIKATTNNNGTFNVTYKPYAGQMGHFVVGACYPNENTSEELTSFDIYGLKRTSNNAITAETDLGDTYKGLIDVVNPGVLSLSKVSVEVVSKPQNCSVKANVSSSIKGGETATINYEITSTEVSANNNWEKIELLVKTAEGATLPTTIYYYCRSLRGKLKASISSISTTMIKGETRDYPFTITNIGKGETGKITLSLPSWMSSATPVEMSSLAKNESAEVILRLTPTSNMQLNNPITGSIGINCENGEGLPLPYSIEPVSTSQGTLTIDVCDEYTYNTQEAPHLSGAKVTIKHPTTGALIASGTTNEQGLYSVTIPEGYYTVYVSADKHSSYSNNLLVDPGKDNKTIVNLSYEAIQIDWNVEETTVEDEYDVKTNVKYETSVPVPVVVLSVPSRIEADNLKDGESLIFYATLTNKGLITAQDVQLLLPTDFKTLTFEALSHAEPFNLAPEQAVQIPVKVTRVNNALSQAMGTKQGHLDNDPCASQAGTLYYWDCGLDRKWHRYGVAMQVGTCKSDDPSTWEPGGSGLGSGDEIPNIPGGTVIPGGLPSIGGINSPGYGGTTTTPPTIATKHDDKGCEPCQNRYMLEAMDCAAQLLVPGYKTLRQIIVCAMSLYELSQVIQSTDEGNKAELILVSAADALSSCAAAKHAGTSDKNKTRVMKRLETLNEIGAEIETIATKIKAGGEQKEEALDPFEMADKFVSLATKLASLAGFDFDHLEDLFCPLKLLKPCDLDSVPERQAQAANGLKNARLKKNKAQEYPSYIQEFQQQISYGLADEMALLTMQHKFFGDLVWLSSPNDQLHTFMSAFLTYKEQLKNLPAEALDSLYNLRPENTTKKDVDHLISRWNNTINGNTNNENTIDYNGIGNLFELMQVIDSTVVSRGYTGIDDIAEQGYNKCLEKMQEQQKSVCSSITLQFSQQMVMTRQAFRGTLTVYNGNETNAMKDVKLNLTITDEEGNVAMSDKFQTNPEKLEGFEGELSLNAGWTLNAKQTGVATVLFIPTKNAAPTVNKPYTFSGTLTYIDAYTGLEVTRTLTPITLTVKPSPNLNLTYFIQRDVLGDDPLTQQVEPSEEAEFALLINNVGYGDATNVRMTTNQPQIVDNEKGLNIQFELVSSMLNGKDKTLALGKSIATDFGTITAQKTAYAQWMLKSSLLGHFTSYNVEANHITSYGNENLSLLNEVSIHELIRSIDASSANDTIVGFLTNDIVDADDTPDMLYLSNGETEKVGTAQSTLIEKVSDNVYRLSILPSTENWSYGNVTDPTYGMATLKSIRRETDGKEMSIRNFWQTDRTLRDGKDPLYENRIHFAVNNENAQANSYILTFEAMPTMQLVIDTIIGVPAENEVATEAISQLKVVFNKAIEASSFTTDDIAFTVQGKPLNANLIDIQAEDNKTFILQFNRLNATTGNGYYNLTIQTSGITDTEGFTGKHGMSVGWTMFKGGKVALSTSVYPALAGSVNVNDAVADSVIVDYGKTIKLRAKANRGYEFSSWNVNGKTLSTDTCLTYNMTSNAAITANFILKSYKVDIDEHINGGYIDGQQTGFYNHGQELELVAVAAADYAFKHWLVDGIETTTNDTLKLSIEKVTSISAVFEQEFYQQKLSIQKGWNWISTYLADSVSTTTLLSHATSIVGPNNNTEALAPATAYKVKAATSFGCYAKGHLFNTSRSITLHTGMNYLGYPLQNASSLSDAIPNAEDGDAIIGQQGFAQYENGEWDGTLETLQPGNGYLYKSINDKSLLFEQCSTPKYDDNTIYTTDVVNFRTYPDMMGIVAQIYTHNAYIATEQYIIYAMVGNECRGMSSLKNNHYYLSINGQREEGISFVIEDTKTNKQVIAHETTIFAEDVLGYRNEPYTFNFDIATSVNNALINQKGMTIYSIDGKLLHQNATIGTLKALHKGVYIIDGQKYVIR